MKKFQFPLESALVWRRQREQAVRARLEELAGKKAQLQQHSSELESEFLAAQTQTLESKTVASEQLAALDGFRRASEMRQHRIAGEIANLEGEIEKQRAELVEAGRQTKLLEKLRDRQFAAWKHQAAQVLEQEASELYLAQWVQQHD